VCPPVVGRRRHDRLQVLNGLLESLLLEPFTAAIETLLDVAIHSASFLDETKNK
jgi:hypothetical protein